MFTTRDLYLLTILIGVACVVGFAWPENSAVLMAGICMLVFIACMAVVASAGHAIANAIDNYANRPTLSTKAMEMLTPIGAKLPAYLMAVTGADNLDDAVRIFSKAVGRAVVGSRGKS